MTLIDYNGDDRVISNYDMLQLIKLQGKQQPVYSHIPTLNCAVEGFTGGELIVLTGVTGHGKTLFAQSLTDHLCKQQEYPLWFTFEMPPREFLHCFGDTTYCEDMVFYMPRELKANDIEWLLERCREAREKYHTKVVFIDHLHFLFDLYTYKNPSLTIGSLVRKLKQFAIANDMIIFLICHVHKAKLETPEDASYDLIRDSGMISCEADTILFVYRQVDKAGLSKSFVIVEKARRTGIMHKAIPIQKVGNFLVEREKEHGT